MKITRNQVLGTFGFLESVFPCLFTVLVIGLRMYVGSTGEVPEGIASFNENFFEVSPDPTGTGFLYVSLYLGYVFAKLVMGILLWHYVVIKRECQKSKYVIWIITTVCLSIIGFLLLSPLRSNHVYEIGMAFIFSVLTSAMSLVTVIYITVSLCCTWARTCDSCEHDLMLRTTDNRRFFT